VVHAINNGFSKSADIRKKLQTMHGILADMQSTITAHHIAGTNNQLADTLSRVVLDDSVKVNPLVIEEM
jgi:hypothetical protein